MAQLQVEDENLPLWTGGPMWPNQYAVKNPETAFRFLTTRCWTWNEAEGTIELIPEKEHIEAYCHLWCASQRNGTQLIVEKSRRMVVSWVDRALMLWSMGLRPEDRVLVHQTYDDAAKHVWRIYWLYEQLRNRNPDWTLPESKTYGRLAARQVSTLILPNGSRCDYATQDASKLQGEGKAGVTIEELALYSRPDILLSQAQMLVQGKPGSVGGHVVAITNASPNRYWQEIKNPPKRVVV
jgi:hypothetical protein